MASSANSLRQALTGLLVIVVGVLLALAAEAAWVERGERIREQAILHDLIEEFRANESRLLVDIDTNVGAQAAGEAWAAAMLGSDAVSSDSLSSLFFTSHWGARFDPVTGVLRSVIDGGELGTIRDDELRAALAGWLDRAEEARLTDVGVTNMRASLAPVLLALEPGRVLRQRDTFAIRYDTDMSDGNIHLIPLLQNLQDVIAHLESQLGR